MYTYGIQRNDGNQSLVSFFVAPLVRILFLFSKIKLTNILQLLEKLNNWNGSNNRYSLVLILSNYFFNDSNIYIYTYNRLIIFFQSVPGGASRKPCRLTSSLDIEADQGCNHLNEPLFSLARSSGGPDLIMLTPTMFPVLSFLLLNDARLKIER